ncbi:hypothetical protein BT69DRAFT_1357685 [Atractiella rhizophila]|nr:hypothetical protein BT69DRAFT_1357685 [Atractiella rhizophila]
MTWASGQQFAVTRWGFTQDSFRMAPIYLSHSGGTVAQMFCKDIMSLVAIDCIKLLGHKCFPCLIRQGSTKNELSFHTIYNQLEVGSRLDDLDRLWVEDSKQAGQTSVYGMETRDGTLDFSRKSLNFLLTKCASAFLRLESCVGLWKDGKLMLFMYIPHQSNRDINFDSRNVGIAVSMSNLAP